MVLKIDFLNKTFSQMEHLNGRSPEWIFWCFFNTFYVFLFFCFFKKICTTNITCESSQPCMRVHMLMKSVNRGWYFVTNITSKFFHFTWVQLCCTSILFLHDTQSYSKGWFSVLFNIAHQTIKVPVHIYIRDLCNSIWVRDSPLSVATHQSLQISYFFYNGGTRHNFQKRLLGSSK